MTLSALLATWFGTGFLPKAPGTWGSLVALPFAFVIQTLAGQFTLLLGSVVVFGIGCWAAEVYIQQTGRKDPGEVVIDEVAGQWLTLAVVPVSPLAYGLGFVLFRLTDIFKPWPISWLDQNIEGGAGVMVDDMVAGVYAGLVLWLIVEVTL
ncbi:MAG: phosphatidylglycerophosphatase A [Alphaproteobacteria bacterium]|nr:phosphatidylglycerophosphatase A [Alphaproteobacteria bacterium]